MVAWTDAAGKYDPQAPLNGNEDNYYADDDLSDAVPNHVIADEDITLSECGMVMAIADGMGGMNAGEIASQIAHDTVAEYFAPGRITPQLSATHESRRHYMEKVIRDADQRIKHDAHTNSEREGMGSTLIIAWLVGDELSITWIGDSRAYRFNPSTGIELMSRDHSYVQELVDKGVITYEQTFEHPQGNIITRSLGDESQDARPDSKLVKVHNGDIILLCSDGLSGVLRDRKIYDESGESREDDNIEDILREHSSSLKECREALWAAAERADWYDNVTVILCGIRSGATPLVAADNHHEGAGPSGIKSNLAGKTFDGFIIKISRKKLLLFITLFLVLAVALGGCFLYKRQSGTPEDSVPVVDTLKSSKTKDKVKTTKTDNATDSHRRKQKAPSERVEKQESQAAEKRNMQSGRSTAPPASKSMEKTISLEQIIKSQKKKKDRKDTLTKVTPSADVITPINKTKE